MQDSLSGVRVVPLTPDCWPAFEDLLGKSGPSSRCWCMYWRSGPSYRKQTAEVNKSAFQQVVGRGPSPGLLALAGELAVGWCQLTPRDALPWLDHVKQLARIDDAAVWSISCFYVRQGYRRRGVTAALIETAKLTAIKAGAGILEAYPLDAKVTKSASFTGYESTFLRCGFETVARHASSRPIMRIDLARRAAKGGSRKTGQ